ncbi:hypothetical protein RO31_1128 [Francisella tularensis subsp. tularensis str. SCHU S4 substr. NR-28534]|nr:hypothetical protein RO31_1128 [Francisella tularensis subsp. tularensis str. SCHU S4 substr. NR-28534]
MPPIKNPITVPNAPTVFRILPMPRKKLAEIVPPKEIITI